MGDGYWAIAGVILRVAGVYVALTEAHAKAVREHIIEEIFRLAQDQDEGNWLWDTEMVQAIAEYDNEVKEKNATSGNAERKQAGPSDATPNLVKEHRRRPRSFCYVAAQNSTRKNKRKNKRSASSSSFSSYMSSKSGQWASDKDG